MKGEKIVKKIVFLTVVIMILAIAVAAQAKVKADSISITPFAGGYFFERNENLKNAAIGGLRAGYNFTENWGMEGFVSFLKTEIQDVSGEPSQNVYGCGIEGLYHFMPEGRFVPFIALGAGGTHYGYPEAYRLNKVTVDYGAGLKIFITDDVAVRADVRHVLPFNDRYNDFLCTLGITFSFGGHTKVEPEAEMCDNEKQAIAPPQVKEAQVKEAGVEEHPAQAEAILDSDRDGVPDSLDKCPGTPASVVVDKNGCPPDSDGDGVPDYLDKCPGTSAGMVVDKHGCSPDSDGDGVPDALDKCPDTPAGVTVDKNGCPVIVEKKQEAELPQKVSMVIKMEFDSGKAVINKKYHKEIKRVADFMKANPEATATIAGHTDSSGNHDKNILLSKARANSVRQYLVAKFGIDKSRIRAFGYGPDKPIASNKTKAGRQKNRRIVADFEAVK
jgi:OmpA-OmpF porin, OOP family